MKAHNTGDRNKENDDVVDHVDDPEYEVEQQHIDTGTICISDVLSPIEAQWPAGASHGNPHDDWVGAGEKCGGPVRDGKESVILHLLAFAHME